MPELLGASPLVAHSGAPSGVPPVPPNARFSGRPQQQLVRPPLPRLSLVIGEEVADGWFAARLIQERPNLDYFLQSVSVRGPFRITRPWRGTVDGPEPATMMPDLGAVSRTLTITWDWTPQPEGSLMLPVFVRHTRILLIRRTRPVKVRLVLRDMTIKGSVTHLKIASNAIRWARRVPWAAP